MYRRVSRACLVFLVVWILVVIIILGVANAWAQTPSESGGSISNDTRVQLSLMLTLVVAAFGAGVNYMKIEQHRQASELHLDPEKPEKYLTPGRHEELCRQVKDQAAESKRTNEQVVRELRRLTQVIIAQNPELLNELKD